MANFLLEGKKVAADLKEELKKEVAELSNKAKRAPVLACVQVGGNPASNVYVKAQRRVADELGIVHRLIDMPEDVIKEDLVNQIKDLNLEESVDAVMIQTPLPETVTLDELILILDPQKDAEGIHPMNTGKLIHGQAKVIPPTAAACMGLLKYYGIKLYGKEVVIIGHSAIVGKPLSLLCLNEFATTTVCHIATSEEGNLKEHVSRAEVLIVAVGRAGLIKGEWIKEGSAIIDVGINKVRDQLLGDVEFEGAKERAAYITPVPGGVGPLTVVMLMRNCVELFKSNLTS